MSPEATGSNRLVNEQFQGHLGKFNLEIGMQCVTAWKRHLTLPGSEGWSEETE